MSDDGSGAGTPDTPASSVDRRVELARHLAGIATRMLAPGDPAPAAQRIVSLAVSTLDGCDDAALCHRGPPSEGATWSASMAHLEALQAQVEQGPCPDTLGGLDTVYVPDLRDDTSWPLFSPEAVRLGFRSALAFRLAIGEDTVGSLQLYAGHPGAFDAGEQAAGLVFARYAALALALAKARSADETRIGNLSTALASREVIGQAQGILMERERITADQAFELLRRSSQRLNRKVRSIAQEIVDTGAVPVEAAQQDD